MTKGRETAHELLFGLEGWCFEGQQQEALPWGLQGFGRAGKCSVNKSHACGALCYFPATTCSSRWYSKPAYRTDSGLAKSAARTRQLTQGQLLTLPGPVPLLQSKVTKPERGLTFIEYLVYARRCETYFIVISLNSHRFLFTSHHGPEIEILLSWLIDEETETQRS